MFLHNHLVPEKVKTSVSEQQDLHAAVVSLHSAQVQLVTDGKSLKKHMQKYEQLSVLAMSVPSSINVVLDSELDRKLHSSLDEDACLTFINKLEIIPSIKFFKSQFRLLTS